MALGHSQLRQTHRNSQQKASSRKAKANRKRARNQERKAKTAEFPPCVYAIRMGPFIKIGFTRDDLRSRVASLQTGSPLPLEVVGVFRHRQPDRLESFVHAVLADVRAAGEWFVCDVEAVKEAVGLADPLGESASWDAWRALSVEVSGRCLAAGWRERREVSRAALWAARGRGGELEDVFDRWLTTCDNPG